MFSQPRRSAFLFLFLGLTLFVGLPAALGQAGGEPEGPEASPLESPAEGEGPAAEEAPAEAEAPAAAEEREDTRISLAALKREGGDLGSSWLEKGRSLLGMLALLGICFAISNNRSKISWRLVGWGLGLQLILGLFVMKTDAGQWVFGAANDVFASLMGYTEDGASFLFGKMAMQNSVPVGVPFDVPPSGKVMTPVAPTEQYADIGAYFAFGVLPTIIFFSALMAVLYHAGVMQYVVKGVAWVMQRTMGTSGSETTSAAGNIFVGQTESPLLVRPFVKGMTMSELMAIMTAGFATVAGGVMAAYIGFLKGYFADIAGHLLSASVMSAPAALVCAKIMVPEPHPEKSETYGELKLDLPKVDANVIDAAARGAGDGLKLALNVGAMLLAFLALIALFNGILGGSANWIADRVYGETWADRYAEARSDWDDVLEDVAQAEGAGDGARAEELAERRDELRLVLLGLAREAVEAGGIDLDESPLAFVPDRTGPAVREADTGRVVFGLDAFDPERPHLLGLAEPEAPEISGVEETLRELSLEKILGWLLAPLAWLMGVPWADAGSVGQLIGIKTIVNEFVAYLGLAGLIESQGLEHPRSVVIATYALCGFANFGSIAIQIGGIGGIAPERRSDLAKLGLRAMIGGTIACLLTATVAGLLV